MWKTSMWFALVGRLHIKNIELFKLSPCCQHSLCWGKGKGQEACIKQRLHKTNIRSFGPAAFTFDSYTSNFQNARPLLQHRPPPMEQPNQDGHDAQEQHLVTKVSWLTQLAEMMSIMSCFSLKITELNDLSNELIMEIARCAWADQLNCRPESSILI